MNDFESLRAEIEPALKELEEKQRKSTQSTLIAAAVAAVIALAAGLCGGAVIGILAAAIGVAILLYLFHAPAKDFRLTYKKTVMTKLLTLFGPDFTYRPEDGIKDSEFNASQLFATKPNRYSTEDLIEGRLGDTRIQLAEIDAAQVRNNGKTTTVTPIFHGIFFIADFHKDFSSRTWVVPDIAERAFGSLIGNALQKMNFARPGKLIKLENIEFERLFAVFGHNEVEARYLLTPVMMERMVELKRRFNSELSFAFTGSRVIIAIAIKENLFEPPGGLFADYSDFDHIRKHFNRLQQLFDIVNDLDLNTRIWTKK